MNATLKKHLEAIKSGTITKTNIIGLRKAFNTNARLIRGYSCSITSPRVTINDVAEINQAIALNEPRVSRELDASGRKVLQDMVKCGDAYRRDHDAGSVLRAAVLFSEWKEPI